MRGGLFFISTCLLICCGGEKPSGADADRTPEDPSEVNLSTPDPDRILPEWDAATAEEFQLAALDQLKTVLKKLAGGGTGDDLSTLVADADRCVRGELRPEEASGEKVFDADGITVTRWRPVRAEPLQSLPEAYRRLRESWPDRAGEPRIKVKHFGILPDEGDPELIATRTTFNAFAEGDDSAVQQTAEWRCLWRRPSGASAPPLLQSIELVELEEVRRQHSGFGSGLVDRTLPILGNLPAFQNSLARDANYWITRLPRLKHRFQHGLAIGDVDGDGIEDVYLCQPERLPNLLLLRQPDGSVREAAAEFGLDFLDITTSALFADFDNDGDQDLAVAFRSPFALFENVGGTFERRFSLPHLGQIFSLAAADYDRDGLLDLYLCRYQNFDQFGRARSAIPLHDAKNGGANALLKNLGDWQFRDVVGEVGLDQNNDRWSTAAAWEDYDRDGDLDLYVANDYGRNNLYRCDLGNDGSIQFRDIAAQVGVEDMTTSMGASWGDPNRDGLPDVYVSNMYSSAGRRVTFQKNFKRNIPGSDEAHVQAWQNASMGNSLFQGRENGAFTHTSEQARIENGQWAWGSQFADLNHDGWEDLLVANGFITGPAEEQDL